MFGLLALHPVICVQSAAAKHPIQEWLASC
jgi:hypothetical protein